MSSLRLFSVTIDSLSILGVTISNWVHDSRHPCGHDQRKLILLIHIKRSCGFAKILQFPNNKSVYFVPYIINLKSNLNAAAVVVSVSQCHRLVSMRQPEHNNMRGNIRWYYSISKTFKRSFIKDTPRIIHQVTTLAPVGMICLYLIQAWHSWVKPCLFRHDWGIHACINCIHVPLSWKTKKIK